MTEKDTPFNLFSSSAKKPSEKKAESEGLPAAMEKKMAIPITRPHKAIPSPTFDVKTQELFDQIQVMQQELASKLDFITKKSGMSKEEVLKMVQGPATAKRDLDRINADLEAFAEKVWGALGSDILPKKTASIKGTNTAKDRKAKTLGNRRNWMRMP